ncbi:hypothetical protein [uncultured Dysgonomonas sp.]|uniref:Uncharacterized protein n=1 Tax=uncultured Dysgonomonas sp. TaxID=206096 RepID=A0A212JUC1_9BACT|nr:hypothetical protein [uncultured Dysgonomonas sp.]SBW03039.1 conserved exported hypothetical protein [uncultured Dysgonomonas sp.]
MKSIFCTFLLFSAFFILSCSHTERVAEKEPVHIVNIINFIRQTEPRIDEITDKVLFETVYQQILMLRKYDLPGTFLLQYDALIDPVYQTLMKDSLNGSSEIGGWWEITQPQVEAAGLKWRGRYSWDWHANVGFSIGYTPAEREKLVDVYMTKFKSIFNKYPASVGCWFIDAHTLSYMHEKYQVKASCNMKDQVGTDGYSMWGGYWNNAYYPSRNNAYMPAQNAENQIPVPIFRMLGSDPIYQYDASLGTREQSVVTLEPVFQGEGLGGSNLNWVRYFFKSTFEDPALNFTYAQVGQENSFTWDKMRKGLSEIQIPILDSLQKQGLIRIETLSESAEWFKSKYPVTPPTATSSLSDFKNEGHKTVWYNSRFYRANILWKDTHFRFRDLHLFDERMASKYLGQVEETPHCTYTTLPILDGFLWSTDKERAGIRLVRILEDGTSAEILCGIPSIITPDTNTMIVKWLEEGTVSEYKLTFTEKNIELSASATNRPWALEFTVADGMQLPFHIINESGIKAEIENFEYELGCAVGKIIVPKEKDLFVFRILPQNNQITIDCSLR